MCNMHKNVKYGTWHTNILQFYVYSFIISLIDHEVVKWCSKILSPGNSFSLRFTHPSSLPKKFLFIHQDLDELCYFQHSIHRLPEMKVIATFSAVPCAFIAYWRTWGQKVENISPHILWFDKNDFVAISSIVFGPHIMPFPGDAMNCLIPIFPKLDIMNYFALKLNKYEQWVVMRFFS